MQHIHENDMFGSEAEANHGNKNELRCCSIYLSKQIFLRRNTSSVTLFVARFSVTSIVMVTSTSAGRMPVHRMPIENVSISIGIFPVREIFIAGRGKTAVSDVTIFMLYGSYTAGQAK